MSGWSARLSDLVRELDASQWTEPGALASLQASRLGALATHLQRVSPAFANRLHAAGLTPSALLKPGGLQRLPPLTRRQLRQADTRPRASLAPPHEPTYETQTSGSTGEPVVVRRTALNALDWMAATLRNHLWHRHDFLARFCAIRADIPALTCMDDWGSPVNMLFKSGPVLGIPITTRIERQVELINDFGPRLLLTYPSNLAAILGMGVPLPSLRQVLSAGETLSAETRADTSRVLGATIADMCSSQELGVIALQCSESTLYHVMAENLIVEVLRADGSPCPVGEVGRLVVTDLRNYATPLVRYEIGDWAEAGSRCTCGRGLPTLAKIAGRERNLIRMPDGTRHWPLLGFDRFREFAPVVQYQLIQEAPNTIEFRLVVQRPLNFTEECALGAHVQRALGFPFELRFTYFPDRIPSGPTGKFEEFVCKVAV